MTSDIGKYILQKNFGNCKKYLQSDRVLLIHWFKLGVILVKNSVPREIPIDELKELSAVKDNCIMRKHTHT